jgi:hypothetical protein
MLVIGLQQRSNQTADVTVCKNNDLNSRSWAEYFGSDPNLCEIRVDVSRTTTPNQSVQYPYRKSSGHHTLTIYLKLT